jgi:hypothetical protein
MSEGARKMISRNAFAFGALTLASLVSGCATFGLVYEDVGHPPLEVIPRGESASASWDPNLNASDGGRELVKKGVACSQDILKLVAWGDGTQAAAAKQGEITEVVGLDFDNTAVLGFVYTRNCTVVYGRGPSPEAAAPPPPPAPEPMVPPAPPDPVVPDPVVPDPASPPPTGVPAPIAPPPAPVPPTAPAPTN